MPNSKAKPLALVKGHRTKAEIETRKRGEEALATNEKIKPSRAVKDNPDAFRYFRRVTKVLAGVSLDEAFYENVLNRYCLLLAEHDSAAKDRERIEKRIEKLEEKEPEMEFENYIAAAKDLESSLLSCDRILTKKRDQLLAIEKENLMTVQGKLRAIPKNPSGEEGTVSAMAAFMERRGSRGD